MSSGLCECGCGARTKIAERNEPRKGWIKGVPKRFLHGHHGRKTDRFHVEDRGFDTPCWTWQLALGGGNYGVTAVPGTGGRQMMAAHKYEYEKVKGPVPEGLQLDHLCRNRDCVNPDHLEPVTNTENVRRGEATKLTPEQVSLIRGSEKTSPWVAAEFGISSSHVRSIRRGVFWAEESVA